MKFFAAFFLALIALGFAGKCDFTCPSAYNAICGSDGKTYHNLCALRQANCKSVRPIIIAALGECSIPKVCDGVSCPVGQFCVARPKQCFTTPCPQYECVDEAVAVCDKVVCPNSRVCAFEPKQCFTTPCPQYTCLNRPTCPTFCTKIYTPVCGTDGKTYGNKCTLESAICSALPRQLAFDYEGECKRDCPDICPQVYQPVCGSDGNTYSNACTLSQASCRSDIPITQVSEGECPSPCAVVLCPPGKFCVPEPKECITTPCDQFKCVAPDCPDACPQVYQPVCGSDGNTYSNACTLSQASCRSDIPITQVSEGECPNPCAVVLCPPGKFCVPEPKQCITTPCDQFKCE